MNFLLHYSTLATDAHTHSQQSLQRPTAPSPQRHRLAGRRGQRGLHVRVLEEWAFGLRQWRYVQHRRLERVPRLLEIVD